MSRSLVYKNWPFVVVGCLIEKNGKFLLVQEGQKERGKWNQPAGWLDKGENPIQGVKREAEEETGLKIKITNFLGIYSLFRKNVKLYPKTKPVYLHCIKLLFVGKIVGEKIKKLDKKEIQNIKWFKPKEIFAMDKKTLRDLDIKDEVKDYLAGRKYPLKLVKHCIVR